MVKKSLMDNILIGVVMLFILLLSTFFIRITVVRNIVRSGKALSKISEGDADLTVSIKVQTKDEIGALGKSFNTFIGKMNGWITQIKGVINDTDNVSIEVASSTEETTSTVFDEISDEIEDTVNAFSEIEHAIEELNIGSQQVLHASEEINSVTISIQTGSNEIKGGTEAILKSSEAVKDISHKGNSGMDEVTSGNNEILNAMQVLVDLSHRLDQIVKQLKEQFGGFKTE